MTGQNHTPQKASPNKATWSVGGIVLLALAWLANHYFGFGGTTTAPVPNGAAVPAASAPAPTTPTGAPTVTPTVTPPKQNAAKEPVVVAKGPGFRSTGAFTDHFAKHGAEFPGSTAEQYLAMAQVMRDREPGPTLLEQKRKDGVITRFDRTTGAFLAFNKDLTIRTFFKPNRGERYFEDQLEKDH